MGGRVRSGLAGSLAIVGLVVLAGGYGGHWSWTGINGSTATLWDWLHLLLLPVAAILIALWIRHRPALGTSAATGVAAAVAAFVVLVIVGYAVPWRWTGFAGNTLWDWLNLAALPVAVAVTPVLLEKPREWWRERAAVICACLAVFAALVLAGYLAPWRWTGFTGNTLWDWLHLLLLPLLLPTVVGPTLRRELDARMRAEPEPGSG
jgi:hypothetical protein